MIFEDVIVLLGRDLEAFECARFEIEAGKVAAVDCVEPVKQIDNGAKVIIAGLTNARTYMGDSFMLMGLRA